MASSFPYTMFLIGILASFGISVYAVQKIIFITRNRKIYDVPDDIRKIHGAEIASLGGIGIFTGYVIVAAFFWPENHTFMPYVLAATVILFFTGIYDDLMNMRPYKKLVAQLVASIIAVMCADIRIESFFGIAGIGTLPYWFSVGVTTLCCTFFINVFNFIDGIDGLAGMLAIMYMGLLGCCFISIQSFAAAGICFALAGAAAGLLYYNYAPAKIYMGDTGSMFLGLNIFIFSLLLLKFVTHQQASITSVIASPQQAMVMIFAMLYLPVFDALRVFIIRGSKGISPLKADRTHLHYYLLDAGFSHSAAALSLVGINVVIIIVAYLLISLNPLVILLIIIAVTFALLLVIYRLRQQKLKGKAF